MKPGCLHIYKLNTYSKVPLNISNPRATTHTPRHILLVICEYYYYSPSCTANAARLAILAPRLRTLPTCCTEPYPLLPWPGCFCAAVHVSGTQLNLCERIKPGRTSGPDPRKGKRRVFDQGDAVDSSMSRYPDPDTLSHSLTVEFQLAGTNRRPRTPLPRVRTPGGRAHAA